MPTKSTKAPAKKPAAKKTTKTTQKPTKKATSTATAKKPTAVDPLLKELLQSGAHFGHRTERWNPKMAPYIFTARSGVHIIDLIQTAEQLKTAVKATYELTKNGGQILFVGTKKQAKPILQKWATDAQMPFVTHRWLGGMLTNLDTIKARIARLKKLEAQKAENDFAGVIKKEKMLLEKQMVKLHTIFDGVRNMHGLPAAIYVVDMPREHIAILEARKLHLPVIAMCDTNANPDMADYPIVSNDDALKAIDVVTQKIAEAAKTGYAEYQAKAGAEAQALEDENTQE